MVQPYRWSRFLPSPEHGLRGVAFFHWDAFLGSCNAAPLLHGASFSSGGLSDRARAGRALAKSHHQLYACAWHDRTYGCAYDACLWRAVERLAFLAVRPCAVPREDFRRSPPPFSAPTL